MGGGRREGGRWEGAVGRQIEKVAESARRRTWLTVCILSDGNIFCNMVAISLDGLSSEVKLFNTSCRNERHYNNYCTQFSHKPILPPMPPHCKEIMASSPCSPMRVCNCCE